MKQEKENKKENESAAAPQPSTGTPLSQTIENANASGDGSLERGKDSLLATDDDGPKEERSSGGQSNEAY